jgi:hypothetical protein
MYKNIFDSDHVLYSINIDIYVKPFLLGDHYDAVKFSIMEIDVGLLSLERTRAILLPSVSQRLQGAGLGNSLPSRYKPEKSSMQIRYERLRTIHSMNLTYSGLFHIIINSVGFIHARSEASRKGLKIKENERG